MESGADASAIDKKQDLLDIGEARLTARKNRLQGRRQGQRRKGVALRQPTSTVKGVVGDATSNTSPTATAAARE